jgi:hypothetical protein
VNRLAANAAGFDSAECKRKNSEAYRFYDDEVTTRLRMVEIAYPCVAEPKDRPPRPMADRLGPT